LAGRLKALVRSARELGHLANPVEHRASNTVVGKGLKAHPTAGVEAVPSLQQAAEAESNQIVEIAPKRELASKPVGKAVHHFLVSLDELDSAHARS
jgi:hypothetical protein